MSTQSQIGHLGYYPEMGEARPAAQIEASLGHYGDHYFLYSQIELKGRGIQFLEVVKPGQMINSRRDGWFRYKVTTRAFHAICEKHGVAVQHLL